MLIPCKECKKMISNTAKTCPHCGKKIIGFGGKLMRVGLLLTLLVSLPLGLAMCSLLAL